MLTDAQWNRFVDTVRTQAPCQPDWLSPPSSTRQNLVRRYSNQTLSVLGTFFDGLGSELTGSVGDAMSRGSLIASLASQDDAGGVMNTLVDTGLQQGAGRVAGPVAGSVVGGLLALLRGGHQSLSRSEDTQEYLIGTYAYIITLARTCIDTLQAQARYPRTPNVTAIPSWDERRHLVLHTDSSQRWYRAGMARVLDLIRTVDQTRPVHGPTYSVQSMAYAVYDAGGRRETLSRPEFRRSLEDYITQHLLGVSMTKMRHNLQAGQRR